VELIDDFEQDGKAAERKDFGWVMKEVLFYGVMELRMFIFFIFCARVFSSLSLAS
jgi:hypothetical protein